MTEKTEDIFVSARDAAEDKKLLCHGDVVVVGDELPILKLPFLYLKSNRLKFWLFCCILYSIQMRG